MFTSQFTISFADLIVKFICPTEIKVPKALQPFLCSEDLAADEIYEIRLLEKPLQLKEIPDASYNGIKIYMQKDQCLRVYEPLIEADGCQVACMHTKAGRHTLYYPKSKWSWYAEELNFLHLIGIEEILIRHQAFLLHSSVVKLDGKLVLFSGPSGIGKSTQATLWENCMGAEILNGDRCIIKKTENGFYGYGSPWAGTSKIYSTASAPIQGIYILKQAAQNRVRKLNTEAFVKLYQQSIVNLWDSKYVQTITTMITELLEQIPVYELACKPDEGAVILAYSTLFKGGIF